ncbi:hypothetical protein HYDPIDRAFT_33914 [Hydnomerulius pinastri MD-312]|uniref:Uncharacterized protein n=1 Tax=Hydnomerulius pinastri MD-312 TaxID=994086 RepID=A0A0C9VM52_9AGAM|nr:hypothetical protein HYDPIDRAFT_33914 [Hydnomerulius pinastri MD-312]
MHAAHPTVSARSPSPLPSSQPGSLAIAPSLPSSPSLSSRSSPSQVQLEPDENPDDAEAEYTDASSHPCSLDGEFLPAGAPPPPPEAKANNDWSPYRNRVEFELAELLFTCIQMSGNHVDALLDLWAATLAKHDDHPPFSDHNDLYNVIDSTPFGGVKWEGFSVEYKGERPEGNVPSWMDGSYEVWFRDVREVTHNILASPDFAAEMDYTPYCEYTSADDKRQWKDSMSGDWAWQQADEIAKDAATHGSTFVPVILGSDKTTVSVGTSHNEYYPLYASVGNVRNNVRRAHRDAVVLIGFLAIPKTCREHADSGDFHTFQRQLLHSSLSYILQSLKPAMTAPEIARFGDGHFRCVIYGLGPYIADYEEQVVLSAIVRNWCPKCLALRTDLDNEAPSLLHCREHTDLLVDKLDPDTLWDEYSIIGDVVPFTNDFPRADIHQLIAPDILHQLIKGTFKDHLVDWVEKYLVKEHGVSS